MADTGVIILGADGQRVTQEWQEIASELYAQGMALSTRRLTTIPVTFASGTSLTGAVDIGTGFLLGMIITQAWATPANMSFMAAKESGGTFFNLFNDSNSEVLVSVSGSRAISFTGASVSDCLAPYRYLKLRAGTSAVPVNVINAVTIDLVAKT